MSQNQFVGLFLAVFVIAIIVLGISKMTSGSSESSPSPSPSVNSLFQQNNNASANPDVLQPPGATSAFSSGAPGASSQPAGSAIVRKYDHFPGILTPEQLQNKAGILNTNKGKIVFLIYPEATKAASNFIILAANKFYDGLTFHRVVPGFVIQGGDPSGNGSGGPGYTFKEDNLFGSYKKGVVAMAKTPNDPPGTGGSQFFIMLEDKDMSLDYAIFGMVVQGQEVVDQIKVGDVMQTVQIANVTK